MLLEDLWRQPEVATCQAVSVRMLPTSDMPMFLDRREETHCDISHEDRDSWELAERGQLRAFFWFSSLRPAAGRVTCCRTKLVGVVARNTRGRQDAWDCALKWMSGAGGLGLVPLPLVTCGQGSGEVQLWVDLIWRMFFKFPLPIFDSGEERRLDTSCLFQLMLGAVVGQCVFYERNGSSASQRVRES